MGGHRILSLLNNRCIVQNRRIFFGKQVNLEFINRKGVRKNVKAYSGDYIYDIVIENNIEEST